LICRTEKIREGNYEYDNDLYVWNDHWFMDRNYDFIVLSRGEKGRQGNGHPYQSRKIRPSVHLTGYIPEDCRSLFLKAPAMRPEFGVRDTMKH